MDAARAERFYRVHAAFYDATRWAFLADRARAIARLDVAPGDRVIDFACGTGLNVPRLLARRPASIVGIDASEAMLARARRKFPPARFPGVSFVQADVTTAAVPEKADRVICTYALSMVDEWRAALLVMERALAPGGRLVVLDFDLRCPRGVLRAAAPALRWWLGLHGVVPGKPYAEFLRTRFAHVEEETRNGGYDAIVAASGPGLRTGRTAAG